MEKQAPARRHQKVWPRTLFPMMVIGVYDYFTLFAGSNSNPTAGLWLGVFTVSFSTHSSQESEARLSIIIVSIVGIVSIVKRHGEIAMGP